MGKANTPKLKFRVKFKLKLKMVRQKLNVKGRIARMFLGFLDEHGDYRSRLEEIAGRAGNNSATKLLAWDRRRRESKHRRRRLEGLEFEELGFEYDDGDHDDGDHDDSSTLLYSTLLLDHKRRLALSNGDPSDQALLYLRYFRDRAAIRIRHACTTGRVRAADWAIGELTMEHDHVRATSFSLLVFALVARVRRRRRRARERLERAHAILEKSFEPKHHPSLFRGRILGQFDAGVDEELDFIVSRAGELTDAAREAMKPYQKKVHRRNEAATRTADRVVDICLVAGIVASAAALAMSASLPSTIPNYLHVESATRSSAQTVAYLSSLLTFALFLFSRWIADKTRDFAYKSDPLRYFVGQRGETETQRRRRERALKNEQLKARMARLASEATAKAEERRLRVEARAAAKAAAQAERDWDSRDEGEESSVGTPPSQAAPSLATLSQATPSLGSPKSPESLDNQDPYTFATAEQMMTIESKQMNSLLKETAAGRHNWNKLKAWYESNEVRALESKQTNKFIKDTGHKEQEEQEEQKERHQHGGEERKEQQEEENYSSSRPQAEGSPSPRGRSPVAVGLARIEEGWTSPARGGIVVDAWSPSELKRAESGGDSVYSSRGGRLNHLRDDISEISMDSGLRSLSPPLSPVSPAADDDDEGRTVRSTPPPTKTSEERYRLRRVKSESRLQQIEALAARKRRSSSGAMGRRGGGSCGGGPTDSPTVSRVRNRVRRKKTVPPSAPAAAAAAVVTDELTTPQALLWKRSIFAHVIQAEETRWSRCVIGSVILAEDTRAKAGAERTRIRDLNEGARVRREKAKKSRARESKFAAIREENLSMALADDLVSVGTGTSSTKKMRNRRRKARKLAQTSISEKFTAPVAAAAVADELTPQDRWKKSIFAHVIQADEARWRRCVFGSVILAEETQAKALAEQRRSHDLDEVVRRRSRKAKKLRARESKFAAFKDGNMTLASADDLVSVGTGTSSTKKMRDRRRKAKKSAQSAIPKQ